MELHEQARREVQYVLHKRSGPEGLTREDIVSGTGLDDLRAQKAILELVLMRLIARKGNRYFPLQKRTRE
jgi:hypothetical protein